MKWLLVSFFLFSTCVLSFAQMRLPLFNGEAFEDFIISSDAETPAEADSIKLKKTKVNIGGALRLNYNYSSWKPIQKKLGGAFGFEVFRINVDAEHGDWGIHLDQRFYAAGFGGAFLKYGWFQRKINEKSHVKLGLIPAYFGTQQFNSHSWFFQLPFYLGFEDDHDMGISYDFDNGKTKIDLGFYKNAETLSFADNAPISDARYSYDFAGNNKEVNQLNFRINHKLGKNSASNIGLSTQYGGIWNIESEKMGSQAALGIHYEYTRNRFNVKTQLLSYNNSPEYNFGEPIDQLEMTAYGAPYNTAAKANIYSIGVAYKIPFKKSFIESIQIYNDYSYMAKTVDGWTDTQMNVLGALLSSGPVYVYVDYAMGLNQPWLGPLWTDALSVGDPNAKWEARFNVNFGYYF